MDGAAGRCCCLDMMRGPNWAATPPPGAAISGRLPKSLRTTLRIADAGRPPMSAMDCPSVMKSIHGSAARDTRITVPEIMAPVLSARFSLPLPGASLAFLVPTGVAY